LVPTGLLLLPMFVAMTSLVAWLLLKGINRDRMGAAMAEGRAAKRL
jgi:hypothetical protein